MSSILFFPIETENRVKANATLSKTGTWLSVAPRTLNLSQVLLLLRQEGFVLEALELKTELAKGTEFALQLPAAIIRALFDNCPA